MIFRVLFAIAAHYNLDIYQMNLKTVFFYSLIISIINVQIFKYSKDASNKGMVCKL